MPTTPTLMLAQWLANIAPTSDVDVGATFSQPVNDQNVSFLFTLIQRLISIMTMYTFIFLIILMGNNISFTLLLKDIAVI